MIINRYISFWGAVFLSFTYITCVNDQGDNPVKIVFTDVVSTYSGKSKICKLIDVSADTTCSVGVTNSLKVIIYNEQSIILEDEKNILGRIKLHFSKTTSDKGEKIHYFELNDGDKNLNLIYNETTNNIQVSSKFVSGNMAFTDYFEGRK
jgi:hypothetical protein